MTVVPIRPGTLAPAPREDVALWCDAIFGGGIGDVLVATGTNGEWVDGKYTFGKRWRETAGRYAWPAERDRLVDYLASPAAARIDVYVRPYLAPAGAGRAKGNATARRLVHADRDGAAPAVLPSIPGLFAVDSGTPGHEHVYVRLADDVTTDEHEALCRSLGLLLGDCDAKVSDNDVLRPVGSLNFKTDPPAPVRWLRRPDATPPLTGRQLGTVLRALGAPEGRQEPASAPAAAPGAATPAEWPGAVREALRAASGDRSADTAKVVHAAYDAGLEYAQARAAVLSRADLAKRYREKGRGGEADLERLWEKAGGWIAEEDAERAPGALGFTGSPPAGPVLPEEPERPRFLDWHALEAAGPEEVAWIVPGLVAARRGHVLYSTTGLGKSLLGLELAVAVSRGAPFLGARAAQGVVLYVDLENDPRGDVWARLQAMGLSAADLDSLKYMSFPDLGPLDSPVGGDQLVAVALEVGASLVVIDTATRTVKGEESSNDTWANWDRCTGMRLRALGCAFLRVDHEGKDAERGQRGGSNKATDVSIIWRLNKTGDMEFSLICEKDRTPVPDRVIGFRRELDPLRSVRISADEQAAILRQQAAIWAALDEAGLAPDAGRPAARAVLRDAGLKADNVLLGRVLKARQAQQNVLAQRPEWAPGGDDGALRLAAPEAENGGSR